jgi:hypothetical protein
MKHRAQRQLGSFLFEEQRDGALGQSQDHLIYVRRLSGKRAQ